MSEPAWVEHAVFWQLYPLGFVGADIDPGDRSIDRPVEHRLGRIIGWLDYAVELGVSGIALGPLFASQTHGYDTVDFFRIDPRLGDEGDFAALIGAAHERGLRVVLDGVFNHVGREFGPFERVVASGARSGESPLRWFRLTGRGPSGDPVFENFEGHDALVALNHDEPAVADFVTHVMTYWLDRGVDGWRLDAAYAVPSAFWATVLPRVRATHPDVYIFGEVIHGDYADSVAEGTLDSLTQYELWKAIWSSISDANFFELAAALDRHNAFLSSFTPVTFVGNHDVSRLATVLDDPRHREHAHVILLTVGGTPTIYYGDEQGFTGLKEERVGGDDAIRPGFPADGHAALPADGWNTYRLHQNLIGLRRRHPWLHRAQSTTIALTNTFYVYEVRSGANSLVVALNVGDRDETFERGRGGGAFDVLAGSARVSSGGGAAATAPTDAVTVTVPAHGWAVLGA